MSGDGGTKWWRGRFGLFPPTAHTTDESGSGSGQIGIWLYRTRTYGPQLRQEIDLCGRKCTMVCRWKVFILWWVNPQGSRMCGEKEGSDISGGRSRGKGSWNRNRFQGIRKWIGQMTKDGPSVHDESFVSDAIKCIGISHVSVSKVEVLERSKEGNHLVITCTLTMNNQEIPTHTLIDCWATGIAFMDQDLACHHQILLQELQEKRQVKVIDWRPINSRDIMHISKVGMMIQDHKEQLPMFVTKLGHYTFVVGIRSLWLLDGAVPFASITVMFGSHCWITPCYDAPVTVQGVAWKPPEPV